LRKKCNSGPPKGIDNSGAGLPATGEQINITGRNQVVQDGILGRLKKIEGQVRGVYKMIEDCRSCGEVVIQLAAIKAAVNRVGATVLVCHMAERLESDLLEGKDIKESLADFTVLLKKFS